ncbi:hypothetical protein O6H91_10G025900 [Diphasiastrum complanatum]|uniref:Uncharacterized protein n=1 Tax=Diphasiastrum complanatum TaxID=34168 RepID=A0ACC2CF98_DIPCM|nr:hypothetical protein O6H91_10G025900 [Diphasiastrum complanatum]
MLFKKNQKMAAAHHANIRRFGSVKPNVEILAPLMEGPTIDENKNCGRRQGSFRYWVKEQLEKTALPLLGCRRSDLRLLLGILGASLGPFPVGKLPPTVSPKDGPIEASSAQYIVQQYIAATGGSKIHNSIKNSYAQGKVRMLVSEFETATRFLPTQIPLKTEETGCFVLWHMMPDKWHVELAVADMKVQAGSNGKLVWRHTPWSGSHAAKGPVRPLRRTLQGLDPKTTAYMFANALCVGEKQIGAEECFILKMAADPFTLAARSDGPVEVIRHVLYGYFVQRTGLLLQMEDAHLIRIQATGGDTIYVETSIETTLEDYKPVEGLMIAHTGRSIVKIFRFGENATNHARARIEETWTIEEVAHNVPGLSNDCFIPPADVQMDSFNDVSEFPCEEKIHHNVNGGLRTTILENVFDVMDDVTWNQEL